MSVWFAWITPLQAHTFHFPWGEMAPTLQDVSMLLGLPLEGEAIGPEDPPDDWHVDMPDRKSVV